MTISERIIALLRANGQTQKALADLLHLQPSTVNTWLKTNAESIPSTFIMPISRFFGITPEELLTGTPEAMINVTDDERKLLAMFRASDDDTRIIMMGEVLKAHRMYGQDKG